MFWKVNAQNMNLDVPVLVMAGGKTRLEPFTNVLPKPLIPVNEKPIIEHIIDRFDIGIKTLFMVNYKGKIKTYFEESVHDYNIKFIKEDIPLGTAGCLFNLKIKLKSHFYLKL